MFAQILKLDSVELSCNFVKYILYFALIVNIEGVTLFFLPLFLFCVQVFHGVVVLVAAVIFLQSIFLRPLQYCPK